MPHAKARKGSALRATGARKIWETLWEEDIREEGGEEGE